MSIAFLAEGDPDDASSFYRAWFPAACLGGIVVREVAFDGTYLVALTDHGEVIPATIVLRRPTEDVTDAVRLARRAGQRVFVDLDDNVWSLPPWSPARKTMTASALGRLERLLRAASGVIVPTLGLARAVTRRTTQPVYVVRSGLPGRIPAGTERYDGPFRVGWMGTLAHRGPDLMSVIDHLAGILGPRRLALHHLGAVIPGDRPGPRRGLSMIGHPWVPFTRLGPWLRDHLDVILIPQVRNPFAESRSPTTGMIAAAAGVVFHATPTAPYRDLFGHDICTPSLAALIDDPEVRAEYRVKQAMALGKVGPIQTGDAYRSVMRKVRETPEGEAKD